MTDTALAEKVAAVRRFNRFYTKQIGVLLEGLLQSGFSLAEARILYEMGQRDGITATWLGEMLGLDAGYLSRLLAGLEKRGVLLKTRSPEDGRKSLLTLTEAGRAASTDLDQRSAAEVGEMLSALTEEEQRRLTASMATIEALLGGSSKGRDPYILRPHRAGDLGWVVHRHGVVYGEEYGLNEQFEGLVAGVASELIKNFDPKWECSWIAEMDGEIVGTVFLVKVSDSVAKLRLLLIELKARGLGLGRRLVDECIRFARRAGYEKITLWTMGHLYVARRIYEKAGFVKVHEELVRDFGQEMVDETWELDLRGG